MTVSEGKASILGPIKNHLLYAKDVLAGIPVYKWPLLPFAFLIGIAGESFYIIKGHSNVKTLKIALKSKYLIDDAKLYARGYEIDAEHFVDSQEVVITIDGTDYLFLLTWDMEKKEPTLSRAPKTDASLPYQPWSGNPNKLLK